MAVAERSSNNRRIAVAVALALGLALVAVVAVVGISGESSSSELQFDSLLNKASADKARHASYQGNVGTVYKHLQEIIDKILLHKGAWAKKYKGDLTRVAGEVAAAVKEERAASKASDVEAGKAAAAAAKAATKKSAWIAKKAALSAKKADAEEEKRALKKLFDKGNAQKGGEIAMIVKIRCMMSKFNKDNKFKCDGDKPSDTLLAGKTLKAGQALHSADGKYKAKMQGDGNFVVYKGKKAIWSTRTSRQAGAKLAMQGDGNLVIYKSGRAKWNTRTHGRGGNRLIMQNDGNLVIYKGSKAIWSSKHGRA